MFKIFKTEQVRLLDAYTIKHEPIQSIDLMERASLSMCEWLYGKLDKTKRIVIFAGSGNNGGDGLIIARLMLQAGYNVLVCFLDVFSNISNDCRLNLERYQTIEGDLVIFKTLDDFPAISSNDVIIDAIFGSGLSRAVEDVVAEIIYKINALPNVKIAIDIPSGLFGEDNINNGGAILNATYTLTLQFPKLSYFFKESANHVGECIVIDIGLHPKAIEETHSPYYLLEANDIIDMKKVRQKFDHKGTFGHALLIAGSRGKTGAAVLSAKACMRGGVGLLTCHIPSCGETILQTSVPEAMLSLDNSNENFSHCPDLSNYNTIAIGPGLGQNPETQKALIDVLKRCKVPIVLDADALNNIASLDDGLQLLPKKSIITPHPKEFARLFGQSNSDAEAIEKQIKAAQKYGIIIVLKGAYTRIALPDGRLFFNATGNPALATAGSGDVLTGLILALSAQKYSPEEAALMAVWLHGVSADLYIEKSGIETMIASDIVKNFGQVFKNL